MSLNTNPKVKELSKSVHICQNYHKNTSGTFFMAHGVEKPVPINWYIKCMIYKIQVSE